MFTTLQTTLDTLVAGQTAIADRLLGVEDQLGAVTALAHSLEALKDAVEDCQRRVEALESKLKSSENHHHAFSLESDWEEVRHVTREEVQLEARKNNVLLSGMPIEEGENVEAFLRSLLPTFLMKLSPQEDFLIVVQKQEGTLELNIQQRCKWVRQMLTRYDASLVC